MGEWEELLLSELADGFAMGPFGSNIKSDNFVEYGVPVIRGGNLNVSRYVEGEFVYLTEQKADELSGSNCFPDDLVLTHRGTLGQVALIPHGRFPRYVVSQSGMKVSTNKSKLNERFLLYFLKSDTGRHELLQNESQVGVPSISRPLSSLKNVRVPVPPLAEQKAIAAVLSSLDDKIDLLHRQNKTLEALAETLFRQWFVEEAQEDWAEKPLDEIADFLNGLACQKYPPKNEIDKLPVLKIRELKSGISELSDWATSEINEEYIVRSGDIVFSWSGSLLVKIWVGMECVLNQHLFKVSSQQFPKWFVYQWTNFHLAKFIEIAESKATTMGHIKRGDLSTSMVLVPDKELIHHMDATMGPLLDKCILNNRQIAQLCKLRDTLLPKIMSGEVRVAL